MIISSCTRRWHNFPSVTSQCLPFEVEHSVVVTSYWVVLLQHFYTYWDKMNLMCSLVLLFLFNCFKIILNPFPVCLKKKLRVHKYWETNWSNTWQCFQIKLPRGFFALLGIAGRFSDTEPSREKYCVCYWPCMPLYTYRKYGSFLLWRLYKLKIHGIWPVFMWIIETVTI